MESAALTQEIGRLEDELAGLRKRVEEDDSSFTALERQIDSLRHRLTETRDAMRARERELKDKRAALADAQRLERLDAYEQDIANLRDASGRLSASVQAYLSELDTYDGEVLGLRKLVREMREAFGAEDERAKAVDSALKEQAEQLHRLWESVIEATKWRLDERGIVDVEREDLSTDLQKRAEDGRAARILEYFGKS